MAIDRKEINLAIKGENRSQQTFSQASKAVRDLTAALKEQVDGVRSGKTTLDDLNQSLRDLGEAGKTLASQQGLIDSFRGQTAALTTLEARLESTRARLLATNEAITAKGSTSARAQARLDALARTETRLTAAIEDQRAKITATSDAIGKAGHDVRDLDAASKSLLTTSQQIGAGVTTLKATIDGYGRSMRVLNAENKAAAEAEKAKAAAIAQANAGIAKMRADQERLLKAVRAAEAAAAKEAADAAAATESATRREVAAIDSEVAALNRLLARKREMSSLPSAATARAGAGTGAADAVGSVISPTAGVRNVNDIQTTLSGIARTIDENVGKPVSNYLGTLQDLERTIKNVQNTAKDVDGFRAQKAAYDAASASADKLQDEVQTLYNTYLRDPTPENARRVRESVSAYRSAASAVETEYEALRVLDTRLKAAGIDTKNLTAEQTRLVAITKQATAAVRDLERNYEKFGGSRREGNAGFLGLRPYEIQNLSFQINDFFTQLASGTSATQAFSQQIGQVAQIQPIWTRLVAMAPAFIALAASIALVAGAVGRLNATSSSNRGFEGIIALRGGQGSFGQTATQLTAMARQAELLGVSFTDARKALTELIAAGVQSSNLASTLELSVRLSRVLGVDLSEAAKTLSGALTGGRDGFAALLQIVPGFNEQARQTVVALLDQGRAAEAQRAIIAALQTTITDADRLAMSPFRQSVIDLKNAWKETLDELGKTGIIATLTAALNRLAQTGRDVAAVMRALRGEAAISGNVTELERRRVALGVQEAAIRGTEEAIQRGPSSFIPNSARRQQELAAALPGMRAEAARLRAEVEQMERAAGGAANATDDQARAAREAAAASAQALDNAERASRTRRQDAVIADKTATADARRAAVRERATARITERVPGAADTERGRALIAQEIATDIGEFNRRLAEETESAGRSGAAAIRRDFQAISGDIQNAIRSRDELVRGIQEDVAAGALSPADAIRRIGEAAAQTRPEIQRLRDEAQAFLDSGRGGNDAVRNAAIQRTIAQADRQLAGGEGSGSRAGVRSVLQTQQQEIQRAIQERQNLVQETNALEEQGVITRAEGEARIQRAYNETNESLRQQIELQRAANDAALATNAISQTAWAATNAQLDRYIAQLVRVDPVVTRMRQGFENVVTSAAGNAFDTVAQSLGEVLAGTKGIADAFDDAGKAALQFAADVLKGIAQIILQEQILIAVKLISKAISAGFGVGGAGPVQTSHSGSVIGRPGGVMRQGVNPAIFTGAPRMHEGGQVGGLRSDERAAILQTGEEVLSRDDDRNIRNRGKGGSGQAEPSGSIRNILAVGDDEIANAMSGPPGERVVMNILRRNATTIRTML